MDVAALLQSFGEDEPSGEDLEYDPIFAEMEIAAQPGEEKQAGDTIIAAQEPDYGDVSAKAMEVLEKSHDLRAAVYKAMASLRLEGLTGLAEVTSYIKGCLEEHWETCHPQLDADDDNDPTMRINSVLALSDPQTILAGVRAAPLTDSRTFGRYSLRDILVAEGEAAAAEDADDVPDTAAVSAAFKDTDHERLREISDAIKSICDDIDAIDAKFDQETPGRGPDLDALKKLLKQAAKKMSNYSGTDLVNATEADEVEAGDEAKMPAPAGGGAVGGVNSPNDVLNAIDRIVAYYKRAEPSSPVPLLLMRAKRLVNADFLDIVKDMAPSGIENVNIVGGLESDDDD